MAGASHPEHHRFDRGSRQREHRCCGSYALGLSRAGAHLFLFLEAPSFGFRQTRVFTRAFFLPCPPSARSQVHAWLVAALHFAKARLSVLMRRADVDEDGELTLNDGEVAYRRLAPVVRRHAALTGGLVGGFVSAYSALR